MDPSMSKKPLLESDEGDLQVRGLPQVLIAQKKTQHTLTSVNQDKTDDKQIKSESILHIKNGSLTTELMKSPENNERIPHPSHLEKERGRKGGGGYEGGGCRKGVGEEGGGSRKGGGDEGRGKTTKVIPNDQENPLFEHEHQSCCHRHRDMLAYWFLGFCNNFTYWVMITAAYDLLTPQYEAYIERSDSTGTHQNFLQSNDLMNGQPSMFDNFIHDDTHGSNSSMHNTSSSLNDNTFECQEQSTGVILIADTLPATALTLISPLTLMIPVNTRVWFVTLLCAASYLTLGLAPSKLVFLGVALASTSRGFSDSTFLCHASKYDKNVLSTWSSGTGVATFLGPLFYSSLTTAGLDPRHALLTFLAIPLVTAVSFWCVLSPYEEQDDSGDVENQQETTLTADQELENDKENIFRDLSSKFKLFMRAMKYIFPLSFFYFIMYLTNQGMLELVYFPSSPLTHAQQYSWTITVRCLGTLIARSGHTKLQCPSGWIYNIAAALILLIVGGEAYWHYLPSEYIIFVLLFIQGLVEGTAFRTSILKIHNKINEEDREFYLGVFPASLFLPALMAGLVAMPVHSVLCINHAFKS